MKVVNTLTLGLYIAFFISGCASTPVYTQKKDGLSLKELEEKHGLSIGSSKETLGAFESYIIRGAYGFTGVGDFTTSYNFSCWDKRISRKYEIAFRSRNVAEERFRTNLLSVGYDDMHLSAKKLKTINKELKNPEIIGSVGLHCSDYGEDANPVELKIQAAHKKNRKSPYVYTNSKFTLTDSDFE